MRWRLNSLWCSHSDYYLLGCCRGYQPRLQWPSVWPQWALLRSAGGKLSPPPLCFCFARRLGAPPSQIRQAFSQYLSPAVIQDIINHPDRLRLGGEERDLTLMFCVVRNFTSISQDLSAIDLTQFINELLSPLTEIILEQRGTIDKYMGDAIMAFWNAPLDDPEQTIHACNAALKMVAKMEERNEMWRQRAETAQRPFKRVNIGMGINSGRCCVGNLGSIYRFDYSAIGDEVNITSRFEGLTKMYGLPAIIGQRSLAPGIAALEVDKVAVKGRTQATQIYTLLEMLGGTKTQLDCVQG